MPKLLVKQLAGFVLLLPSIFGLYTLPRRDNTQKLLLEDKCGANYSTMTASYPTPPPAPKFNHTTETILSVARDIIKKSTEIEDGIAAHVKPEDATFENVLTPLSEDQNQMALSQSLVTFYQHVSAVKALRDQSSEAQKELDAYGIKSSMRQDIYQRVHAVNDAHKKKALKEEPEAIRFLEKTHRDYIRQGLALSDEDQEKLKKIQEEIANLELEFSKTLGEENGGLWFTKDELKGIPEEQIAQYKEGEGENEGKFWITFKYPDYLPAMRFADSGETRRKLFIANENKCNSNVEVFKKALKLKDEKAKMLGYKSHAAFVLETKMAKDSDTVMKFLNDLREKLTPGGQKELEKMKEFKKKHLEERGEEYDGKYWLWDHPYYNRLMLEKEYSIDQNEIANYFPLSQTINGMLKIFEELFGLEFVEEPAETKDVWHPDTQQFRVYNEKPSDGSEQTFVGWLYLDLHPREGKYAHAANFGLQAGFIDKDGKRHYPATSLVCNFSKPTPKKPSTLKHDEVVTLFHELGHGIHDLVAITRFARFHGTATVRDFVEAPSQMLENWCWSPEELTKLSGHWETGEKLPKKIVDDLIRSKHVNDGIFNLRQLHFGLFDMAVHDVEDSAEVEKLNLSKIYNTMRSDIALLDSPEDPEFAHGEATFGHLMGGYDAGYYGYLWSQVFSTDMFYSAFKKNPMDPKEGRRYRHQVLEKGGARDEMDSLKEFLGREPNSDAFLKELGLA